MKILYSTSRRSPRRLEEAYREAETILRRLRKLPLDEPNDSNLSTSEQIIRFFDRLGGRIVLATAGLAAVSLLIGGIRVANVMVMGVTERTREIGTRLALGARRRRGCAPRVDAGTPDLACRERLFSEAPSLGNVRRPRGPGLRGHRGRLLAGPPRGEPRSGRSAPP